MSAEERNVDARTAHTFAKNTSLPFAGDSTTPVFPAQQPQALTVSLNHRPANVNYLQSQEHTTAPAPPSHVTVYSGITPEALLPPLSQQPEKLSQQRPQFTAPVSTQTPTQTSSLALSQPPVSDEVILGRSKEALPPETAFRIDQQQRRPQTTKFSGGSSTFRINHAGAQVHYNSVHPGSFGFIRSIPRSAPQSSTAENPQPFLVSLRPLVVQNIQPPDTSSASVQAPLVPSVPATNEIQTSSQALYAQLPLLTYAGHISTSRLSPQTSRLFVQSPEAIKIIPSPNLSGVQPSSQAQVPHQLPGYVLPPQNVVSQPLVPKSQRLPSIALLDERPVLQPSQQVVVNQQQDVTKASQAPELQYVDERLATPGTSQDQIVIGHQQKQRLPVSVERLTDPTATVQVQPVPQQAPLTALYTNSIVSGQITKQIGQQIPAPVQQAQTVVRQEQPSLIPTVQSVLPPNGQQIHLINNEQATFSVNQADTLGKIRQKEAPVQKQGSEIQRQQIQHVQLPQQQIDIQQESSFSQPPFQLQHQAQIIHVPVQYQLQEHAPSVGNQQTIPQFRTHFPLQVFRPAQQTLIQPTVFSNNLPSLSGGQISSSNSPYPLPVFTYVFRNSRLQTDPSGLVGNQNRHTNIHSSVVQNNFRTGHNDFRTIRPILGIGQSVNIRPSSKSFFGASNSFGSLPSPSNFEGFHVTHLEGTTKKGATALSNFRPDVNGILSDVYR